jgi:hypothetical protein
MELGLLLSPVALNAGNPAHDNNYQQVKPPFREARVHYPVRIAHECTGMRSWYLKADYGKTCGCPMLSGLETSRCSPHYWCRERFQEPSNQLGQMTPPVRRFRITSSIF